MSFPLLTLILSTIVSAQFLPAFLPSTLIKEWLSVVKCMRHLPAISLPSLSFSPSSQAAVIEQLLLPTTSEAHQCHAVSSDTRFCFVDLSISPFVTSLSLGVGMCLPAECSATQLSRLASLLCALPQCSAFTDILPTPFLPRSTLEAARDTCARLQPAICGPDDRFRFQRRLSLHCVKRRPAKPKLSDAYEEYDYETYHEHNPPELEEDESFEKGDTPELLVPRVLLSGVGSGQTWSADANIDGLQSRHGAQRDEWSPVQQVVWNLPRLIHAAGVNVSKVFGSYVSRNDWAVPPSYGNSDKGLLGGPRNQAPDPDELIDWSDFAAISACGTRALREINLLLISGHRSDRLGDWTSCQHIRHKGKADYCAVKQGEFTTMGRCVPPGCTAAKLKQAVTFMSHRHCLVMANLFPVDLCAATHVQTSPVVIQPFKSRRWDASSSDPHQASHASFLPFLGPISFHTLTQFTFFRLLVGPLSSQILGEVPPLEVAAFTVDSGIPLAPPASPLSLSVYCGNDVPMSYWLQLKRWTVVSLLASFLLVFPVRACWPAEVSHHSQIPNRSRKLGLLLPFPRRPPPSRAPHFHLSQAANVVVSAAAFSPSSAQAPGSLTEGRPDGGASEPVVLSRSAGGINDAAPAPSGSAQPTPTQQPPSAGVCVNSLWGCFNVADNWATQLKTVKSIRRSEFSHLCGMRVLSIMWLVVGSTVSYTQPLPTRTHIVSANLGLMLARQISPIVSLGASLTLDTFFFYTGFLVAVHGGPSLAKALQPLLNRGVKCVVYAKVLLMTILHRCLRQSGVYLFVLTLYITGPRIFASLSLAPLWPALADVVEETCRPAWLLNVFFVNNLFPANYTKGCFPWSWYVANDFQFFIISAVLLVIKFESRAAFRLLVGTAIGSCVAISVIYVVQSGVTGTSVDSTAIEYYIRPWYRLGSHLLGLAFGSLFVEREFDRWLLRDAESFTAFRDGRPSRIWGWMWLHCATAALAGLLVALALWPGCLGMIVDAVFMALHRPLWCLCVGWWTVSLALVHPSRRKRSTYQIDVTAASAHHVCFQRQPADNFSQPQLTVVPRSPPRDQSFRPVDLVISILSQSALAYGVSSIYGVYLVHPMVAQWFWAYYPQEIYPSRGYLIFTGFGFIIVSFAVAAILTLFVELPLTRLFGPQGRLGIWMLFGHSSFKGLQHQEMQATNTLRYMCA